jgi:hypothetical protein
MKLLSLIFAVSLVSFSTLAQPQMDWLQSRVRKLSP